MSQPHGPTDDGHGPHYEIRLQGHLDPRWTAWFDGLTLTRESDGTTVIHGSVVDQAALHGLLGKHLGQRQQKVVIGVDPRAWTPEYWERPAPDEESTCREADRLTRPSFERKRLN